MGRNMSGGILTRISICKSNSWRSNKDFDLKENINKILNDIGNFIDISRYDVVGCDDGYELNLNVEFINENIYDLLVEMNKVNNRINFVSLDYDVSSIDNQFIKEHPITCFVESDNYHLEYDGYKKNDFQIYRPLYWILSNREYFRNVEVNGSIIPIWYDVDKFFHEDESFILIMMNTMKTKYFKSDLSKCMIFEVLG